MQLTAKLSLESKQWLRIILMKPQGNHWHLIVMRKAPLSDDQTY